jgi:glycerophosphoryl diester phosphodiesterase
MGSPYLELDVRVTLDGEVVVIHDETADRTTNGSGSVRRMNLGELRLLDAGHWFCPAGECDYPFRGLGIRVPTLSQVLETFPHAMVNIEVKQGEPPMEEALREVLVRHGALERVLLASENAEILTRVRERFGTRVATGISREEGIRFARWVLGGRKGDLQMGGQALQIPERLAGRDYITSDFIRAAHDLGLEVHVWTVNDPVRMRNFVEMGADGVMTDFPDRFPGRNSSGALRSEFDDKQQ